MCSLCSGRTTARSVISKALILVPVLSFSVLFHITSAAGWHCQQGPVPGCPYLSPCPGCANRQHSCWAGRSGTSPAMPRRLLLFCCGFFFLGYKPKSLIICQQDTCPCHPCSAGTAHLQQSDHSPTSTQICSYPWRISGIFRDNGRWRNRQDWRC